MEDNVAGGSRAFQVSGGRYHDTGRGTIGTYTKRHNNSSFIQLWGKDGQLDVWFAGLDEDTKRTIITILGIVAQLDQFS